VVLSLFSPARSMSQKSPSSLEELEARCEALSRRVVERPARSPLRHGTRPTEVAITANPPSAYQEQSITDSSQLNPQDIATAVASLEREKYRLEEQLKLVNCHLVAYRIVQQSSNHQPQAIRRQIEAPQFEAAQAAQRSPITVSPPMPQPVQRYPHASEASNSTPALVRAPVELQQSTSPPRPPSAPSQTEHIYEELRQIRKMREEREAARHSQLQAQSGVATGSYRPTTGQRF
jgi:hypothetical protein